MNIYSRAFLVLLLTLTIYIYSSPIPNEEWNAEVDDSCKNTFLDYTKEILPFSNETMLDPLLSYVSFIKQIANDTKPIFEALNSLLVILQSNKTLNYNDTLNAIQSINISSMDSCIQTLRPAIKELKKLGNLTLDIFEWGSNMGLSIIFKDIKEMPLYFAKFSHLFDVSLDFVTNTLGRLKNQQPYVYHVLAIFIREFIICNFGFDILAYNGYCSEKFTVELMSDVIDIMNYTILQLDWNDITISQICNLSLSISKSNCRILSISKIYKFDDYILLDHLCIVFDHLKKVFSGYIRIFDIDISNVTMNQSGITAGQWAVFLKNSADFTKTLNVQLSSLIGLVSEPEVSKLKKALVILQNVQKNSSDYEAWASLFRLYINTYTYVANFTNFKPIINQTTLSVILELFSETFEVLFKAMSYLRIQISILYVDLLRLTYKNLECLISKNSTVCLENNIQRLLELNRYEPLVIYPISEDLSNTAVLVSPYLEKDFVFDKHSDCIHGQAFYKESFKVLYHMGDKLKVFFDLLKNNDISSISLD